MEPRYFMRARLFFAFCDMLIEGQFSINDYPQVLSGGFSGHWDAIERERRVDWLVIF